MEVRLQQEKQELMVQLERLRQVKLVPLVEMEVHLRGPLMVALGEHRRLALVGHLKQALEGHLRVARILQVGAERHLVATLALTAAPSPWMRPLLLTPASPRWCFYL